MMPATTRARRITLSEADRHGATRARGDDFQSLLCATFGNGLMSARRRPD
jgi:hypothetical protein